MKLNDFRKVYKTSFDFMWTVWLRHPLALAMCGGASAQKWEVFVLKK